LQNAPSRPTGQAQVEPESAGFGAQLDLIALGSPHLCRDSRVAHPQWADPAILEVRHAALERARRGQASDDVLVEDGRKLVWHGGL